MNISEFARLRGVEPQTVSRYISRHKDDFEEHTTNDGKSIVLDEIAISILEKQYPLPIDLYGVSKEEYDELKAKYEAMTVVLAKTQDNLSHSQDRVERLTEKYLEAESNKYLLEDREKQLKEKDEALSRERERADQERRRVEELQKELEKERNKTWWDKLRRK